MSNVNEMVDKLLQELRRGTITIAVLSQLEKPQYGYSLVSILADKGIQVEAGTLYPLLRRLEKQGLLISEWDTNEARPRKFYVLSPLGKDVYIKLLDEWKKMASNMAGLIEGGGIENGDD
ncbi:PadR family transcriptional regulator [Mesobacillus jeotgali]|uniref:PadR family transcriptional regulator n=1 Tax=Mesobacillus jeotgali TaxID=129985 RepID=UPI001780A51A|nr:PadR family transcriptional regulator [Mesobacillus jeotgali]UYZ22489.1 PadR family transcriptional regulator [Mesobacillus jeotgali]